MPVNIFNTPKPKTFLKVTTDPAEIKNICNPEWFLSLVVLGYLANEKGEAATSGCRVFGISADGTLHAFTSLSTAHATEAGLQLNELNQIKTSLS